MRKIELERHRYKGKIDAASLIDEIGVTKFAVGQLILVTLAGILEGFDYMLVVYTMPQIAAEWGLDSVATGSLSSWAMLGMIVGGLAGGYISDRHGRRKTMIGSVLVFSLFTTTVCLAPNYAVFALMRIVAGLALGAVLPLTVAMAAENATTKTRSIAIGLSSGATPLGFVAASLVGMLVIPLYGWRPVFLFAVVGVVFALLLGKLLVETPFWALANGREQEACVYVNKVKDSARCDLDDFAIGMLYIPPKRAEEKASYVSLFGKKKVALLAIGSALIYFCAMCVLYGVEAWYPTLMLDQGLGISQAYGFSLAMNVAGIAGNVVAGYLVQGLGRCKGNVIGFASALVFIVVMAFASGAPMMVASAMLVGFSINYLPSSVNAVTPELFPTNARGSGVSFVMSCGRFAGFLAPVLAGLLLELGITHVQLFLCFTVPCLVGIVFTLVFFRNAGKEKTLAEV